MFEGKNHVLALATVIGTMGGFQPQPAWLTKLSQYSVVQILLAAVLVYQGGGGADPLYSLVVATLFYIAISLSSYINIGVSAEAPEMSAEEVATTESEAENFMGYY